MHKKILAACAALVAFAAMAVVPAMASASPELRDSAGRVAVGAEVWATNTTNIVLDSPLGTITCSSSVLKTKVLENSGTSIKAETVATPTYTGTGTGTPPNCTSTWGVQFKVTPPASLCLSSTGNDTGTTTGGTCAKPANVKFTLDPAGGGECDYERTSTAGTYETGIGKDTITFETSPNAQTFTRTRLSGTTELVCPKEGTLTGTYTLETPAGSEVYFN